MNPCITDLVPHPSRRLTASVVDSDSAAEVVHSDSECASTSPSSESELRLKSKTAIVVRIICCR